MNAPNITLESVIDLLVDRIATGIAARLAMPRTDDRILLARVVENGAPSSRWVTERARHGQITIRGPRGARYVLRAELDALLAATRIAKRRPASPGPSPTLEADVRGTLVSLAARRSKRSA